MSTPLRAPLRQLGLAALLVGICLPPQAFARIKLITLPVRERVEIHLDHPDATLVEEERIVPLVQGTNQVDFSWDGAQVDADSILFRLIPGGDDAPQAKVLAVSYPPNENALVWSVAADRSGSARVRVGYLLGGLEKAHHYRAVANHDETALTLSHHLRLKNLAGEGYDGALLDIGLGPSSNQGKPLERPVGLAETRDLLLARHPDVPVHKRYTVDRVEHGYLDAAQNKLLVPMHYVIQNRADAGLGQEALPFGKARIFQADGQGGTAFVGEDWAQFTPRDDELALYLGVARDIVVKRTIDRNERTQVNGNLYHQDVVVKYEIQNFKDRPVTLDIREHVRALRSEIGQDTGRAVEWQFGKEGTLNGPPDPEHSDADRLVLHVELPAKPAEGDAPKQVERLHLVLRNEW